MESVIQFYDTINAVNILPKVVNMVVTEYVFSSYREEHICNRIITYNNKFYLTVRGDKIYIFDHTAGKLSMQTLDWSFDIMPRDGRFAFYNKCIYVYDVMFIQIFDEQCEKKDTIRVYSWVTSNFVILNDIFFMYSLLDNCIEMFDIRKIEYKRFINTITRTGLIEFDCTISKVVASPPYLYVLLENSTIFQLSHSGKILKRYMMNNRKKIIDFYVVENEIYIIYLNMSDVFVYDISDSEHTKGSWAIILFESIYYKTYSLPNTFVRKIYINNPEKIFINDNTICVRANGSQIRNYDVHLYCKTKTNLYSLV